MNIALTPNSGPISTSVSVLGSGYGRKQTGLISLDGATVSHFSCDPHGSFTASFVVPSNASVGVHTVSASGATASFNVTATPTPAPVPAPTPSGSILWGAYIEGTQTYAHYYGGTWGNAPWDTNTWNKFEANVGRKVTLLHYGQPPPWEQAFQPTVANLVTARGASPFMDMSSKSASLHDIAVGVYDSVLKTWAAAVKTWGKTLYLRWNWEMNGTWFPWGIQAQGNPADYVAAWRHFHDLCVTAGATNIKWVWCPNIIFTGSTSLASLYPGDAYVDWTGMDGYNWGTAWQSFDQVFQPTYNAILALTPSKPMMIGETGCVENGGSKSAWITDAIGNLATKYPAVRAFCWFNWRIYEKGIWQEWPIESSSTTQSAFAAAIQKLP